MLIMCLFSLSAVLAPLLIAIYILQHFTLGKEPTLMVPNWQTRAVERQTICCLLRGGWSALEPACVCARVRVCVYTCTCACCVRACVLMCMSECMHGCTLVCVVCVGHWGGAEQGGSAFTTVLGDPCPHPQATQVHGHSWGPA